MKIRYLFTFTLLALLVSCVKNRTIQLDSLKKGEYFHATVKQLTDIIVHDIFSPPVASRVYAYPNIAVYECLLAGNNEFISLAGQLTDFTSLPQLDN